MQAHTAQIAVAGMLQADMVSLIAKCTILNAILLEFNPCCWRAGRTGASVLATLVLAHHAESTGAAAAQRIAMSLAFRAGGCHAVFASAGSHFLASPSSTMWYPSSHCEQ
ncbi:unnamed protein product [Polarella glacialis]|uniref:Uncharacterized protein n=1 Tax=Polarella glacialis TaxID=89957 RepID=A0A813JKS9_POLGL|nr:unnamed protein product [Polarella glacialis]